MKWKSQHPAFHARAESFSSMCWNSMLTIVLNSRIRHTAYPFAPARRP